MISIQCQSVLSWEELTFLKLCLSYIFDIQIILNNGRCKPQSDFKHFLTR